MNYANKISLQKLRIWVPAVLLAYMVWFFHDSRLNLEVINSVPAYWFFGVCSLTFISFVIRFLRWHILLVYSGYRLPIVKHFLIYIAGFAFTATPGKSGEMLRSFFLKQYGIPFARSIGLFLCDRFFDLISLVVWACIFLFSIEAVSVTQAFLILCIFCLPLVIIWNHSVWSVIDRWGKRIDHRVLLKCVAFAIHVRSSLLYYLTLRRFIVCVIVGMVSWSLIGLVYYTLLIIMGHSVTFLNAMGASSVGLISGALSLIPAGIGLTEYVQSSMVIYLGGDEVVAANATFLSRICTLWFAIILGCASLSLLLVSLRYQNPLSSKRLKNADSI